MLFSHVREDGTAIFFTPQREHRAVHVTGSFTGWQTPGVPMRRIEEGFIAEVGGVPWGDVEYKLIADGRWVNDPLNPSRRGENSLLHRGTARGTLAHLEFHAPSLRERRGYVVYLPPGYTSGRRFPTLYLLHGALDYEKTWIEKGDLATTIDKMRNEGQIGEMIVVMPRDNGELFRGDSRYADYLARDVVGHVDHEFPTMAEARRRGLDGLSTGGFTSVVMGAWRPDVWRSIGSMSGCHDGRSFEAIRGHAEKMRGAGQRYRISCGLQEPHVEDARSVQRALAGERLHAEWAEAPGTHDWPLWRWILGGHLRFHWEALQG